MRVWSASRFGMELPVGHRFPERKFARVRELATERGILREADLAEPARVAREDLLRVHSARWVDAFLDGTVSAAELRRLGLPWTRGVVERSLRSTQATLDAARDALSTGRGLHLGGGTHHAFPDRGEGFCVWNDVAVAIRALQAEAAIARAAVVDLDVHQGNGTAAIFAGDDEVYTFSMHSQRNYPFDKETSRRDVGLPDGAGDPEYLGTLAANLPEVLDEARPDLVVYLAGVDPHEGDKMGRLKMTAAGLRERDRMVLAACRARAIPICVTLAGGYGETERVAGLHLQTVAEVVAGF